MIDGRAYQGPGHAPLFSLRLALKLFVLLGGLFVGLIALIRVFPYQRNAVQQFLSPPPDCVMPCWMGIRPGVTTDAEAAAILSAHEWGGEIVTTFFNREEGDGILAWVPSHSRLPENRRYQTVRIHVRNHIVRSITLPPGIPFDEIWFVYGKPTSGRWTVARPLHGSGLQLQQGLAYDSGVHVMNYIDCPFTRQQFWAAPSNIQLGDPTGDFVMERAASSAGAHDVFVSRPRRGRGVCDVDYAHSLFP
jgi:hypothetical protein